MPRRTERKDKEEAKLKGLIEEALDNITENPGLPDGIPTLLDIPERRPLPDHKAPGTKCLLVRLVQENPKTYETYLLALKKGAYFQTAAAAVGIPVLTMYRWSNRGKKDFEDEVDSYYSRFYQDVLKAVGQCRVAVEQSIATMQPWKWLSRGPGRIFGEEWAEKKESDEGPDPLFLQKQEPKEVETTGREMQVLKLDDQTEAETLAQIEKAIRNRKENKDASTE